MLPIIESLAVRRVNRKHYRRGVSLGYERMARYNVAICTTVRDCGTPLRKNIPTIEKLRSRLNGSCVIAVENDSVDDTKQVLSNWTKTSKNITILSNDYGVKTIIETKDGVDKNFSSHRISRMSAYRNQYLEALKELPDLDFVVVIDLDVERISIDGIAHSFGQEIDWNAISSNGIKSSAFSEFYEGYKYFDTYAFCEIGDNRPRTKPIIFENQLRLKNLKRGMPLYPVASAFGGMAIYEYKALMSAEYQALPNEDPEVGYLCEHIALHKEMTANGYHRIFINPSQYVIYETYCSHLIKVIKKNLGLNKA
jgi:hypothetical protein